MLAYYIAAETKAVAALDTRWGDRRLIQQQLEQIRAGRKEWEAKVAAEQRAANGAPRDNKVLADFSNFAATERFGGFFR